MAKNEDAAYKLMCLDQVYLLTTKCEDGKKTHVIPQLWAMPVSFKPQRIAVAVAKDRFTNHLLEKTGEFVLNIPSQEMAAQVWSCAPPCQEGDKFSRAKLTPMKALKVKPPLIKECLGALECRVANKIDAGDHTIFIADVLATHKLKSGKVMVNAAVRHEFSI